MFFKNNLTKSCRDSMLKLAGCEIWSPNSGDPCIKGPQPRIITKRQEDWLEKLQRDGNSCMEASFTSDSWRKMARMRCD